MMYKNQCVSYHNMASTAGHGKESYDVSLMMYNEHGNVVLV